MKSEGDLPTVYRALVEARGVVATAAGQIQDSADYIVSTYRALQLPVDSSRRGLASFELLGQRTYSPGSPAGWPDRSADWDGASALMKRIEWADAVGQRVGAHHDAAQLAPQLLGATLGDDTRTSIARAASAIAGFDAHADRARIPAPLRPTREDSHGKSGPTILSPAGAFVAGSSC